MAKGLSQVILSLGKEIRLFDITGIGICYHSSQIKWTDWTGVEESRL